MPFDCPQSSSYLYIYICIYVYVHVYIYICIYIYVYMYMCVYMYICIHFCIFGYTSQMSFEIKPLPKQPGAIHFRHQMNQGRTKAHSAPALQRVDLDPLAFSAMKMHGVQCGCFKLPRASRIRLGSWVIHPGHPMVRHQIANIDGFFR